MTWIKTLGDDEATGVVRSIFAASEKLYGFVPNIRRALSLNGDAMRAYTQLSGAVYHGGALTPAEREMIATVVSAANGCHY